MHFCSIYLFVALLFLVAFHFISSLFFFHFFFKKHKKIYSFFLFRSIFNECIVFSIYIWHERV